MILYVVMLVIEYHILSLRSISGQCANAIGMGRAYRMEVTDDPKLANAIKVLLNAQDHTLGNMIRS